jgi:hypothetical protein
MASTVVEKKRTWLKPLMRGVAIVLSLAGSFAVIWVSFFFIPADFDVLNWAFPEGPVLAVVSALLFRSWWAILVIPIAFSLGELLAYSVLNPPPLDMAGGLWMVIGPMTAILGALIGTFIVMKWGRNWLR